jgi:hypothetical protein
MQADRQPDAAGGGAASGAGLGAALDAAFAAVERVLAEHGPPTAVSKADASAVAELLVRGLASADAGVACRAATAIARFARGGPAAGHAVAEASGGAAMPALARLATSGDGAATDAALMGVGRLLVSVRRGEALPALLRSYAATDGAVEGVIGAVMQQASPLMPSTSCIILLLIVGHRCPLRWRRQTACVPAWCGWWRPSTTFPSSMRPS